MKIKKTVEMIKAGKRRRITKIRLREEEMRRDRKQ